MELKKARVARDKRVRNYRRKHSLIDIDLYTGFKASVNGDFNLACFQNSNRLQSQTKTKSACLLNKVSL